MKASISKTQSLSDIQILFKPVSITFRHAKHQQYKLYLQKNVQVIGEIKQIINSQTRLPTYVFAYDIEPVKFRITDNKIGQYQLSIYSIQDGVQTYIESAKFDLSLFIKGYFKQFLKSEEKLTQQMIGKRQGEFIEIWAAAKTNIISKVYNNTLKFNKTDAFLEFICTPQPLYDRLAKESNLQDKNKVKKGQLAKSKTMPDKLHFQSPLSTNYSSSEILSTNKLDFRGRPIGSRQVEIKIKYPANLSEIEEGPDAPINNLHKSVTLGFQHLTKKEPILIDQNQEEQNVRTEEVPQVRINNFRDTKGPQIKPSQVKIERQSQIRKGGKVEQQMGRVKLYFWRCCELGIYIFVIMILMHPKSKVR